jgi:hypothetical protein
LRRRDLGVSLRVGLSCTGPKRLRPCRLQFIARRMRRAPSGALVFLCSDTIGRISIVFLFRRRFVTSICLIAVAGSGFLPVYALDAVPGDRLPMARTRKSLIFTVNGIGPLGRAARASCSPAIVTTLRVGIATLEQYKQRTLAIARGQLKPAPAIRKCGSAPSRASPRCSRSITASCCA